MPKFTVEALEKFVVRTVYRDVEANNAEEAEALCKAGSVGYDTHSVEEGDEEWLKTVSVEQETCSYCGGNCPNEPEDSEYLCDGFAGDIDGLYAG